MAKFVGVVYKESGSDFGVSFPDFPGCVTAGKSLDDAMEMAQEALRGHIEVMHDLGEALPSKPMTLDAVKKHKLAKGAEVFIAVEAPLPSKPIRVNVMLDSNLLQRIDRAAKNRSAFLNEAALHELERRTV